MAPMECLRHYNDPAFVFRRDETRGDVRFTRQLGLNETGFKHGARAYGNYGASDCFFSATIKSSRELPQSVFLNAWARCRIEHPLLSAKLTDDQGSLECIYQDLDKTIDLSSTCFEFVKYEQGFDRTPYRDSLVNGHRRVRPDRLSELHVIETDQTAGHYQYEFTFIIAHFITDGLSMFGLTTRYVDLLNMFTSGHQLQNLDLADFENRLPAAMEASLPPELVQASSLARLRWRWAVFFVMFNNRMQAQNTRMPVIPATRASKLVRQPITKHIIQAFSADETRQLIDASKINKTSLGCALTAAAVAAIRNLYFRDQTIAADAIVRAGSPINFRPYCSEQFRQKTDDLVLMIGFLDADVPFIGPSFTGNDLENDRSQFWLLSRAIRRQNQIRLSEPLFVPSQYMYAVKRTERYRSIADDRELNPESEGSVLVPNQEYPPGSSRWTGGFQTGGIGFGCSSIGDLDKRMHSDSSTESRRPVNIEGLNFGVRVRENETLLHSYTLHGRFFLSLVYDESNFDSDIIQAWLDETRRILLAASNEVASNL